jgi:integrase
VSVHRKGKKWTVRYRESGRNRSRTFARKRDADHFDAEVTRRRELGGLVVLDAGRETLDDFVIGTWAPTYAVTLAPKTRQHYAQLYDHHIAPDLGDVPLRDLRVDRIARWQADRLAAGGGAVAVRHALDLLGSILQRAAEAELIPANPVRLVRRARRPRREEVRPLAPGTIERMRAAACPRDATLISVLGYTGLRPSEALALAWDDVRENTILVQSALSLGEEDDTKTRRHRTVRLLTSVREDLDAWRAMAAGNRLVFPAHDGDTWSLPAYQSWRRRTFRRATTAAEVLEATPYTLRHSFASLLLHEGRSVIYVARQLGHDARLTLSRYGHVIDELEDQPRVPAETAIREARERGAVQRATPSAGVGSDADHGEPDGDGDDAV